MCVFWRVFRAGDGGGGVLFVAQCELGQEMLMLIGTGAGGGAACFAPVLCNLVGFAVMLHLWRCGARC